MCACAEYSSRSCYLRAVFSLLRAPDCAATIEGRRLFKEIRCILFLFSTKLVFVGTNYNMITMIQVTVNYLCAHMQSMICRDHVLTMRLQKILLLCFNEHLVQLVA